MELFAKRQMFRRSDTRVVNVGSVAVGGGAPVSVQTMCNIDPLAVDEIVSQLGRVSALGCDICRLTVPDLAAAEAFGRIRKLSPIPLVADIHFDYKYALAAIANGADALRINPGNIGSRANVQAVARAAKEKGVPIRVGVNMGSLEKALRERVELGTLSRSEALCESALSHAKILEDEGFYDIVISAKASNVPDTIEVYRLLAERTSYPLHLGVTEAGTLIPGTVRSSVALGILLSEGIGDTIRVSLTDRPEREVLTGLEILRSLNLRAPGPSITSCPTCGRTKVKLFSVASKVEEAMESLYAERLAASKGEAVKFPHVAVMGCAVNGPGEAKGADIALCGGDGEFVLYVNGEIVEHVSEEDAVRKVVEYAVSL